MSGSVANRLRRSGRPRWVSWFILGSSLILVAFVVVAAFTVSRSISHHNTVQRGVAHASILSRSEVDKIAQIAQDSQKAGADQAQRETDAAAAALAAQQVAQQPTQPHSNSGGSGLVKCPPGTVPGAVDDVGNESNCAPPCQAYNDQNICISPGSLTYRVREPEVVSA